MNPHRVQRLFQAARRFPPPEPPADLAQRVLRAIRADRPELSLAEQLTALYPRLALAAGLVVLLGLGMEYWFSVREPQRSTVAGTILTEQWLFATTGD